MADSKMRPAAVERFERQIIEQGEALVEKWSHLIDAEDAPKVEGAYDRYALATMLDTQNRVLSSEAVQTTTVFGQNYVKSMLGMTRQIFPRMFGTRLVAVQPMDRPSGTLFHLAVTRDDGSSLGVDQRSSAANWGSAAYGASKDYANHTTGEAGPIQKSMKLGITQSNVSIEKVKKLKTEASWELQTDLSAVHGLSALDLLQGAAVDEIAQELDATIVQAVRAAALAHKTVTFGPAPGGYPVDKWPTRIQRAIMEADKAIFKASLRHPNVLVAGIDAFVELQDLNTFRMAPSIDWETASYGVMPVGTLNGQYEVMLSRHIPDNEIILGRRGSGFLDAGVIFSPYVALFISDRFFDVEVQKTVQSFASRYDIFTVANHLYARIVIDQNATAGISVS